MNNTKQRWALPLGALLCIGVLLLSGAGTADAGTPISKETPGKLSYRLALLTEPQVSAQSAATQARTLSLPASGAGSLLKNDHGEPLVYIRVADISESNLGKLTGAGAHIVHVAEAYNTVTAYVNTGNLKKVASLAAVENVWEALAPHINRTTAQPTLSTQTGGVATSEGYTQLKVDQAYSTYGVTGDGIIVGVLSDSYNKVTSPTSAVTDTLSGDLPGPGNPNGHLTPVTVTSAYTGTGGADEGRAMLQIVHDLAPDAELAFATASNGFYSFADNIRKLRNEANADVIVDDVYYYLEPFFQDGPISEAIEDVTADGALYFTSAGNSHAVDSSGNAIASYEAAAYRPTSCPELTLSGSPYILATDCHDFDPGATSDNTLRFTLENNGYFTMIFQWAEPWYGVTTDLDICVTDEAGNILAGSDYGNPGTQTPFESFYYQNTTGAEQDIYLIIGRYSGTATPRIKYILSRSRDIVSTEYNEINSTDTFGPTIAGHSSEDTAISVAAVPYDDSTTPEYFSSRGYPTHYYDSVGEGGTPAAALSSPETRFKPDVAATDGGANTFFGSNIGGTWRFYGTSAAAPHAAAVAALMQQHAQQNGTTLSRGLCESIMEDTADLIANGSPQASGAGLVNAYQAVTGVTNIKKVYLPLTLNNK